MSFFLLEGDNIPHIVIVLRVINIGYSSQKTFYYFHLMCGEALDSNSCEITRSSSNTAAWSVPVRPLFTADILACQGRESGGVIPYVNGGLVPFS